MTKNVLYVGNYLKGPQRNPSYMFTLGPLLQGLGYQIGYTSSKEGQLARLLDMIRTVMRRRHTTDLVLIDTYSTRNFYYAVIIGWCCRYYKIPYVPILHGGQLPQRLHRSPKLSKALFGLSFMNVAPSGYLQAAFKAQSFKTTLIPNVIPVGSYAFKERPAAAFKLLWVRRLQELYNPMMAVKALKVLKEQGHKARLCMIGPDYDGMEEQLRAYAIEHQLDLELKGAMSRTEWMQEAEQYDLFLNTSKVDNTPLCVIEAMALGLAAVSTNVGGMPYLIADGVDGLLVPSDDSQAMAEAVVRLVGDPELFQAVTKAARARVESFDGEVVKEQWIKLFNEVSK
jgi:glycosyltransferase involved in cell wall biosynthesis